MRPFISFLIALMAYCPLQQSIAQSSPDPGTFGTYAVAKDTFDFGDLAYKPDSFPNYVELRGSVHYPASLSGGPFPVLVLLHGRHSTCYRIIAPHNAALAWPPPSGYTSITSFEGYDYFAKLMASHGCIVISISCNAINAFDNTRPDRGMNARGQLLQKHLDLWQTFNTVGGTPFGSKFVGKLDMNRVATMGHSRGGEGVIYHALLNRSMGSPYGLKAVLTLAPVDFFRKVLNGIPLMNIAPYCDGDVVGLSGVYYYDDARYNDPADTSAKYNVLMMGANHNYYNTVWTPGSYIAGTSDDWYTKTDPFCSWDKTTNGRLDTTEQKAALTAYAAAFFRKYLFNDTSFDAILEVQDRIPPASALVDSTKIYVSYHAPPALRLDVNRVDTTANIDTNTLTGEVKFSGSLNAYVCGAGLSVPDCGLSTYKTQEPHRGTATLNGLGQLNMQWASDTDYLFNQIPAAYQDVSGYRSISFRTTVNFALSSGAQNLSVCLKDVFGKEDTQSVNAFSGALFYPPGTTVGLLPKAVFNTVKIPLSAFKGVNQTQLAEVRFLFNTAASGAVLISDLAFEGSVNNCAHLQMAFADSTGSAYYTQFRDSGTYAADDSLVWTWSFGDPATGAANTADIKEPVHIFSGPGSYKVCLKVKVYRDNGTRCEDSICKTVTLLTNHIAHMSTERFKVYPNPATKYLYFEGLSAHEKLALTTLSGQAIAELVLDNNKALLPPHLAKGLYFIKVFTEKEGQYCLKLLIE